LRETVTYLFRDACENSTHVGDRSLSAFYRRSDTEKHDFQWPCGGIGIFVMQKNDVFRRVLSGGIDVPLYPAARRGLLFVRKRLAGNCSNKLLELGWRRNSKISEQQATMPQQ